MGKEGRAEMSRVYLTIQSRVVFLFVDKIQMARIQETFFNIRIMFEVFTQVMDHLPGDTPI